MCGIAGFMCLKELEQGTKKLLAAGLLEGIESRGKDATGIFTADRGEQGYIQKAAIPASRFISERLGNMFLGDINLLHTRAATHGKPEDNRNNHPIPGKKWVITHNGMVARMNQIATYAYNTKCDTELLLSHVEAKGIENGLEGVKGSAAVAMMQHKNAEKLHLFRHNNPLWIGVVPERALVWASTRHDLQNGVTQAFGSVYGEFSPAFLFKAQEHRLYSIDLTTQDLDLKIDKKDLDVDDVGYSYYRGSNTNWRNRFTNSRSTKTKNKKKEEKKKGKNYCNECGAKLFHKQIARGTCYTCAHGYYNNSQRSNK